MLTECPNTTRKALAVGREASKKYRLRTEPAQPMCWGQGVVLLQGRAIAWLRLAPCASSSSKVINNTMRLRPTACWLFGRRKPAFHRFLGKAIATAFSLPEKPLLTTKTHKNHHFSKSQSICLSTPSPKQFYLGQKKCALKRPFFYPFLPPRLFA